MEKKTTKKTFKEFMSEHKTEIIAGISMITSGVCGFYAYRNYKYCKALTDAQTKTAESLYALSEHTSIVVDILSDGGALKKAFDNIDDEDVKKELIHRTLELQKKFDEM